MTEHKKVGIRKKFFRIEVKIPKKSRQWHHDPVNPRA